LLWGFRNEILPYAFDFFEIAFLPIITSVMSTIIDMLPVKSPLFETFLGFVNCISWSPPLTIIWTGYSIASYAIIVRNTLRI